MKKHIFLLFLILVSLLTISACADFDEYEKKATKTKKEAPSASKIPPEFKPEFDALNKEITGYHNQNPPEIGPPHAKAHTKLGVLFFKIGNFKEGEYNFKRAIRMVPNFAPAHFNLGRLFMKKKQYKQAIDSIKTALNYDKTLREAHKDLSDLYKLVGNDKESEIQLNLYNSSSQK